MVMATMGRSWPNRFGADAINPLHAAGFRRQRRQLRLILARISGSGQRRSGVEQQDGRALRPGPRA